MRKLVRGGSDEARLTPYEGEDMAKREKLTDKERQGIYTMHCMGESNGAIADRYEIAVSTVYRIIREQRAKREEDGMAGGQQIVAGDKANGRLMTCSDRNRFEGTCIVGGKSKKKTFTAVNARNAKQQWEKWCQTLRDEQAFMDMVERKPEEQKVVCGYPGDPIEEIRPTEEPVDIAPAPAPEVSVRPWREIAEERQAVIDELMAKIAEYESGEWVSADVVRAITAERDELKAHDCAPHGTCYAIITNSEKPTAYGFYSSEDAALSDLDVVGRVANALGKEDAFTVLEGPWVR